MRGKKKSNEKDAKYGFLGMHCMNQPESLSLRAPTLPRLRTPDVLRFAFRDHCYMQLLCKGTMCNATRKERI